MASAPLAHLRAQCEAEIASHREEEAAVLAEIGAALDGAKAADESTRLGLERGWSDALIETAVALARQVEDGRHVAERVSSGVRKLDSARQHAQSAIEIAESLASLRELATRAALSMTRGDLRAAAECVQDFHKMELIAGVMEGDDYVALTSAEAALRERVREVVTRATEAGDDATTLRWLPLLPPLGLSESLLPAYMAHARRALANRLPAASVSAAATDEIVYMQQLINECASFLQEQLPKANASLCSADGDRALLQLVHGECEKACIASATRFTAARELASWIPRLQALQAGGGASAATAAGGSSGGASEDEQAAQDAAAQALLHEADGVLEEVACVLQHLESWDRFARHAASSIEGSARASAAPPLPATTPLNEECAELGGRYADLEHQLLEAALGKTILIDNLEELASEATSATANASAATARAGLPGPVEAGVTSSCVEDAFFVTQRCAKRALMTGHSGSACAVLNHVSSALTVNFLGSLNERLVGMMSALPSASVGPELTPSKLNQIASAKAAAASAKQAADALARQAGELARQAGMGLGVGSSGTDSSQLLFKVCVAMNNVEAAATYCVRMHDTLHHEAAVAYSSDNDQLSACIADLRDGAAERYQDALKDARARLASALRSSLSTVLSHAVANHEERASAPAEGARESVGHRWALTENAFEVHDAIDEFGVVLGSGLTKVLGPMTSWLSRTNNHELLSHCAEHLARRFELSIRKCAASHKLTALGAIQLDKDVRALVNYFVTRSDNGYALREKLSRLLQLTKLLNSDTEEDAAAFSSAHLVEEDVRDAVKLREWP